MADSELVTAAPGERPPAKRAGDRTILKWLGTAAAGVVLFAAAGGAFIAALWAVNELVTEPYLQTIAVFVFALAFLLVVISAIVAAFSALRLASSRHALALPDGSIRAIIALILVLVFVVMAIYLVDTVFMEEANDEARNVATQLLATVGTLVAAVSAFYFGTAAVTTGATAATSAFEASASETRAPGAVTKGSKHREREDEYELHGFVNPHGRETTYYFEYGENRAYGNKTAPTTAGAGMTEQFVSSVPLSRPRPRWHFRLVALSDAGTTYGDDATIDPVTKEKEEKEKPERDREKPERDREKPERDREKPERDREKPERATEREKEREKPGQDKPEGETQPRRASPERKAKADQEEE